MINIIIEIYNVKRCIHHKPHSLLFTSYGDNRNTVLDERSEDTRYEIAMK